MKLKNSFHLYAAASILLFSLVYILTRFLVSVLSPFALAFWRFLFASVALLVIMFAQKTPLPKKKDWKYFIIAGGIGFFMHVVLFNIVSQGMPAATSSMILSTIPIVTALGAGIVFKEKLLMVQWVSLVVAFIGIVLLSLSHGNVVLSKSVLILLVVAIDMAVYNLLQHHLTLTYTSFEASAYSILMGALMFCVFIPTGIREAANLTFMNWVCVALLGVVSTAFGYMAWSKAFSLAKDTSSVSNYMFLIPIFTTVIGIFTLNEIPKPLTLIGGGIVLLGLALFYYPGIKARRQSQKMAAVAEEKPA